MVKKKSDMLVKAIVSAMFVESVIIAFSIKEEMMFQVILGALNDLASTIPEAKKITVSLIN